MNSSARFSRVSIMALVAMMCFAMPFAASAQDQTLRGTSFTTDENDQTIAWNDNWEATLQGDDEFSTLVMLQGQINIYSVMFIHDPLTGLNATAVYYSLSGVLTNSFDSSPKQSVEWEGPNGSFFGVHVIELSGIDFVLYLRVDPAALNEGGPMMQLAAAPMGAFPSSVESMQADLSINGQPVLAGDDGEEIMDRLNADAADSASEAPASAEQEPAPVGEARPSTLDRGRFPVTIHDQPLSESASAEYVSDANDFTVTYGDSWQDMSVSNATIGEFSLVDSATNRTVVSFTGRSTTETNREAYFQDIVARESRHEGYVDSFISDDRLLIATWTSDNELSVLEYVFVDDDTVVTIMVSIKSSNLQRDIDAVQTIQLNGVDILHDWDEIWPKG